MKNKFLKIAAFTLAEVLITLGIIGMVAVLTIPPLMQNSQDAQFKTAWKKEYSDLSQAYAQILNDNGGTLRGAFARVDWYADSIKLLTFFADKMKVTKFCNATSTNTFNCWHPYPGYGVDSLAVHDKQGGNVTFWGPSYPAMMLNDGTLIHLYGGNMSTCLDTADCGYLAVDINGPKGPNVIGKDIYSLQIRANKLYPDGILYDVNTCNTSGWSCAAEYLIQ